MISSSRMMKDQQLVGILYQSSSVGLFYLVFLFNNDGKTIQVDIQMYLKKGWHTCLLENMCTAQSEPSI